MTLAEMAKLPPSPDVSIEDRLQYHEGAVICLDWAADVYIDQESYLWAKAQNHKGGVLEELSVLLELDDTSGLQYREAALVCHESVAKVYKSKDQKMWADIQHDHLPLVRFCYRDLDFSGPVFVLRDQQCYLPSVSIHCVLPLAER